MGIIIGTYSSIFIASTLLVQLRFSIDDFKEKEIEKLKVKKKDLRAMYEHGTV